eukprot:5804952-Amphidinium_carterae.1
MAKPTKVEVISVHLQTGNSASLGKPKAYNEDHCSKYLFHSLSEGSVMGKVWQWRSSSPNLGP